MTTQHTCTALHSLHALCVTCISVYEAGRNYCLVVQRTKPGLERPPSGGGKGSAELSYISRSS